MSALGRMLRQLRRQQGKTLKVVAERSGMTKSYLCMIERGRARPPVNGSIVRLARALDADEYKLLLRAWVERSPRIIRADLIRMLSRLDVEKSATEVK